MKKIIVVLSAVLVFIGSTAFADDVSIDGSGNITTGVASSGNLEVTGASAEKAIVGQASGTGGAGVYGINTTSGNYGYLGWDSYGIYGYNPAGWAGYFQGNARVTGNLTVDGSIIGPVIGDLTGVTAGTGLSGGGMSGDVTLNVNFTGTGVNDTVSRSDHNHDGIYSDNSHSHDTDYVNASGDTLTGTLNLPANGLIAGTNQLVLYNGNVGIGKTNPDDALDVLGNAQISNGDLYVRRIIDNSDTSYYIDPGLTNSTYSALFKGNVGIGTITPSEPLHLFKANSSTENAVLKIEQDNPGNWAALQLEWGPSSNHWYIQMGAPDLRFNTGGLGNQSPEVTFRSNGNVGIGTTSPSEKLQVNSGNILLSNNQYIKGIRTSDGSKISLAGIDSANHISLGDPGAGNILDISQVNQQITMQSQAGIIFKTGSKTEKMRIDDNGNVGIGTSTPSGRLHIETTGGVGGGWSNSIIRMRSNAASAGKHVNILVGDIGAESDNAFIVRQNGSDNSGYNNLVLSDDGNLRIRGTVQASGIKMPTGASAGYVLTTDATGTASWQPSTASGDITGVAAGTGLSGGGLSGDVTLNANTTYLQRRVSSSCTAGSSIRAINEDGTVVCETDDGIVSESDPQVGTLTSSKWCTSDGSQINCTNNTPVTSETDPKVGSISTNYVPKWNGSALSNGAIYDNGNVGVGTSTPGYKLHVNGAIRAEGNDIAEPFDMIDINELEMGDVVIIDPDNPLHLKKSNKEYDTLVAGIISSKEQAGYIAGGRSDGTSDKPLALAGRVHCKVNTENGRINIGDLLTTSNMSGYAMKATDRARSFGAVIGKALEPLETDKGTIMVLVALQ